MLQNFVIMWGHHAAAEISKTLTKDLVKPTALKERR
jgi:hypothetical protein